MKMQETQQPQPSTKRREGLGFLVENVLSDTNADNIDICLTNDENKCDKKYDDIKQCILAIFKKIKERKHYNHKTYNICNKNDATFSYINYSKVRDQYRELLKLLYGEKERHETKHRAKWHVAMLCRLLAYTRDISDGCGERELSYMQVFELARMDAEVASHVLKNVVASQSDSQSESQSQSEACNKSPIGSWKDIKGLVAFMRRTMNMRDERDMAAYLALIKYAVKLVNERLAKDVLAFYNDDGEDNESDKNKAGDDNEVSFVSKWIPRENKSKKYGNFYERLACDYYKDWLPKDRNVNPVSYEKAVVKCKIHYRKLVSLLNQYLETPQVKMCQQRWSDIALSKTTRLTRDLQDRALLNLKTDDHRIKRYAHNSDRNACAEKYKVWKCDAINCQNGINTDLETHVRVAEYYSSCSSLEANRNAEWMAFATQKALKSGVSSRVIPVLAGNSHKAIGLALAVAENAATGRALILKDGKAVKLYDLDASFVKNVKYLRSNAQVRGAPWYSVYSHPMYKCLILVLQLLIESNVSAKQTRNASEESGFTVAIFVDDDDDLSQFVNDEDVSFAEVLDEASLLYREFGYGVPNVVLWAMASAVGHEKHDNNDDHDDHDDHDGHDDHDDHDEPVTYNAVSHGGALTIRVGCDKDDICTYLGIKNNNNNNNKKEDWEHKRLHNQIHSQLSNNESDWQNEWNNLVEMLYRRRYYKFEQCFWKQ